MKTRAQLALVSAALAIMVRWAPVNADVSAEMMALTSDVTSPYRTGTRADRDTSSAAITRALAILGKENLLSAGRARTESIDSSAIIEPYGKALALGARVNQFIPEIGTLHDAVANGNESSAKDIIAKIYAKAGRPAPDSAALESTYRSLRNSSGEAPATERFAIARPDYKVEATWARAANKFAVEVVDESAPGRPTRTMFEGYVVTRPDASGTALELAAQPAAHSQTISSAEANALRGRIDGRWWDGDRRPWDVTGSGPSIQLAETYPDGHQVKYSGTFSLAKISAAHPVDDPADIRDELPMEIKTQLASSYHPPYRVTLEVRPEGNEMVGTWSSQAVTYSSGFGQFTVEKIHDAFDIPLLLTRTANSVPGAADGDRP